MVADGRPWDIASLCPRRGVTLAAAGERTGRTTRKGMRPVLNLLAAPARVGLFCVGFGVAIVADVATITADKLGALAKA